MNRVQREFQPVGNAELVEDVVKMVLNRLLADEHLLSHFAVLVALRYQAYDLALALAERRPFAPLARRAGYGVSSGRQTAASPPR